MHKHGFRTSAEYAASEQGRIESQVFSEAEKNLPPLEAVEINVNQFLECPDGDKFVTLEDYEVLEEVARFTENLGTIIQNRFWDLIQEQVNIQLDADDMTADLQIMYETVVYPRLVEFIKALHLDTPRFQLFFRDAAIDQIIKYRIQGFRGRPSNASQAEQKEMWKRRLTEDFDGDSEDIRILVFQFPEFVAQYWKQHEPNWQAVVPEISNDADGYLKSWSEFFPWGDFYRDIVTYVWSERDKISEESDKSISLQRINDTGEHSEYDYYYVWNILTSDMRAKQKEKQGSWHSRNRH